jgi:Tol biopolymer transport system component
VKILPEAFAQEAERLARFEREARTLASLNHPHIAQIHGLEEGPVAGSGQASVRALVMELVEGEDLSQRVARGPVPLDEALVIARQICDALEAAHEQGIIHRDLKPANIKVRGDGSVKVLDFGLAKAMDEAGGAGEAGRAGGANVANSPTLTAPTQFGMILGTAAYMAPEQAKGRAVDKRADIWAFGCVLYEMLTGRRAFDGEDVSEVLASVINKDPDWTALPNDTPRALETMLARCLVKDRKRRLADIADARLELDESTSREVAVETRSPAAPRLHLFLMFLAGVLFAATSVLMTWKPWVVAPPRSPMRLHVDLGAEIPELIRGLSMAAVLSRDGTKLAFIGRPDEQANVVRLYFRDLAQLDATPLPGTENAQDPFFSPDGEWIGFFADNKLKKVSVRGGSPLPLATIVTPRGGAWAEDGSIIFSPDRTGPLMRVSATGGTAEPLTQLADGDVTHRWPQVLQGDSALIYTAHKSPAGFEGAKIVAQPLRGGPAKTLRENAVYGRYVPSGHLIYMTGSTLRAAAFDRERLELRGDGAIVLEGVQGNIGSGSAQFDVSHSGALLYFPGDVMRYEQAIDWVAADGRRTPLRSTRSPWISLQFSPDGQRLVLDLNAGQQGDVWIYDLARDQMSRLTLESTSEARPIWSPDGRDIAFLSDREPSGLYVRAADGSGETRHLTSGSLAGMNISSWHPGGGFIMGHRAGPGGTDIFVLPIKRDDRGNWTAGEPAAFAAGPFREFSPRFSSDGRWVAYQSNETGQDEIFVQPFPGPGPKVQVSTGGGIGPIWSRRRQELFFRSEGAIMVATFATVGGAFRSEKPRAWAPVELPRGIGDARIYDLHPDGSRFAVPAAQEGGARRLRQAVLVLDFADELRRLVPTPR